MAEKTPKAWAALAAKELKDRPVESSLGGPEGFDVKPLYTAADLEGIEAADSLPGFAPFLRGVRATMYAGRPWTIRQYAGFSTAEESNAFYRKNLAAGQRACRSPSICPPIAAMTAIIRASAGDVGKAGVAIDSVEDMKILFAGIPLDKMSVSMTMNGAVMPIMADYIVAAEEQGVALGETLRHHPERHSQGIHGAQYLYLSARAYHAHRRRHHRIYGEEYAEIQFDLDQRLSHARSRRDGRAGTRLHAGRRHRICPRRAGKGLEVDAFAPRLSFFFGIGMNFFMEIAKLRAARLLWAQIMAGFGAKKPESLMLRTHCQTSGVSLTEQDPYNNIVRTAYEALAAVLGGTQSLHTNSFDEAIALPTEFSARIARNTQLILQHETQVTRTVDPLGGSLLRRGADRIRWPLHAKKIIDEVEAMGGMTKAVEAGTPKLAIEEAAARRQARIDKGEDVIVGVNRFELDNADAVETRDIDNAAVRDSQLARLKEVKAKRDPAKVAAALDGFAQRGGGQRQSAHAGGRGRARPRHRRRNLRRHREGASAPSRQDAHDLRRLWRRLRRRQRIRRAQGRGGSFRQIVRQPAAHSGRQDGPGRPRPRLQSHRQRLRRHRLRGGHRRIVSDARRSGQRSGGSGRACGGRFQPRSGPQDAGAAN